MEGINRVPADIAQMIPIFHGDARELPGYIHKCEYVIAQFAGGPEQNEYLFHVLTSRLAGSAAILFGEREDTRTWAGLKVLLKEHFGDPRSEKCLLLELQALKLNKGESYLEFCHRIQHFRNLLLVKVAETVDDVAVRTAKHEIYTHTSFDVFLYNLPPYLVKMIRLRNVTTLEGALKTVLEEENFNMVYNIKNPFRNNVNIRQNPNNNGFGQQIRQDRFPSNNYPPRPNFNQRSFNNFNSPSSSQQFRNNSMQNRNYFNTRNHGQQVSGSPQMQTQQSAGYSPQYQHVPSRNMASGSNTDVTMRTASARRVNYIENNDADPMYFEPRDEPAPGPSYRSAEEVENFFLMASRKGLE
jgi:hypothetical protein